MSDYLYAYSLGDASCYPAETGDPAEAAGGYASERGASQVFVIVGDGVQEYLVAGPVTARPTPGGRRVEAKGVEEPDFIYAETRVRAQAEAIGDLADAWEIKWGGAMRLVRVTAATPGGAR